MGETFNKSEEGAGYGRYHVVNGVLLAVLWLYTVVTYGQLPEQIPGHIGLDGVTRWERRESGFWFMLPLIGSVQALVLYALSGVAEGGAAGVNMPQKQRLLQLPREAQRYAMAPMRAFMYGMVAWLLLLMLCMQVVIYQVAVAGRMETAAARGLVVGTLAFTTVPILMAVQLNREIRRRIDEWESSNPDITSE